MAYRAAPPALSSAQKTLRLGSHNNNNNNNIYHHPKYQCTHSLTIAVRPNRYKRHPQLPKQLIPSSAAPTFRRLLTYTLSINMLDYSTHACSFRPSNIFHCILTLSSSDPTRLIGNANDFCPNGNVLVNAVSRCEQIVAPSPLLPGANSFPKIEDICQLR